MQPMPIETTAIPSIELPGYPGPAKPIRRRLVLAAAPAALAAPRVCAASAPFSRDAFPPSPAIPVPVQWDAVRR